MPDTGLSFGQYHLSEKIAQGGMAEIFKGKAIDAEGLEKTVVIKRILPQIAANPEFVSMLIDEAKIAVNLSQGNIAQVYDLGKVGEDYFIVMEYVPGKSLSQIARRLRTLNQACPIAVACYIASEIAAGLDYMHRRTSEDGSLLHIIHRDISPQNIIVSEAGTVKIIDFGIAKAKTKIVTTDSGIVKGKFAYMSPEHAEGETIDSRSDIFSLGIILFELLTGKRLFKGKNNAETMRNVKKARVSRPSSLRRDITPELDAIVLKALSKSRNKRYQEAGLLKEDLTRHLVAQYPDFKIDELSDLIRRIFAEEIPTQMIVMDARAEKTEKDKFKIRETISDENTGVAHRTALQRQLSEFAEDWESSMDSEFEETSLSKPIAQLPLLENLRPAFVKCARWLGLAALLVVFALGLRYTQRHWNEWSLNWEELTSRLKPVPASGFPRRSLGEGGPVSSEPIRELALPSIPGTLVIESTPPEATLYLNEAPIDRKTPLSLSNLKTGTYKVGLLKEGYQYWELSVRLGEGELKSLKISLQADLGFLEVRSAPNGAKVFVNDLEVGQTPYRRDSIPPNTQFKIRVEMEGFEPFSAETKVFAGRTAVVNAPLKKLPRKTRKAGQP